MKFTEAQLEQAFISLLQEQDVPHVTGNALNRKKEEVLLLDDLRAFLRKQYANNNITANEIEQIVRKVQSFPASDLYDSNKAFMKLLSNGFELKREDPKEKDIWVYFLDYTNVENNLYKMVNQMEIDIFHLRIPDGILYINGLPLVVFEFKSSIRENATVHNAYEQLTVRYERDIPNLFVYNAFCVISDGVNNKAGSFFSAYDFFYAWRSESDRQLFLEGKEFDGIASMTTMIKGMLNKQTLCDIARNFIYIPDTCKKNDKILFRNP